MNLVAVALMLGLTGAAMGQKDPDVQYVTIYQTIQEADRLKEQDAYSAALMRYREARNQLERFQTGNPDWNPDVVSYRLDYISDKIATLNKELQAGNTGSQGQRILDLPQSEEPESKQSEIATLRKRVRNLTQSKRLLEAKLREALKAQPANVNQKELVKAEAKIKALQKENRQLQARLSRAEKALQEVEDDEQGSKAEQLAKTESEIKKQGKLLVTLRKENQALKEQLKALKSSGASTTNRQDQASSGLNDVQLNYSKELKQVRNALAASQKAVKKQKKRLDSLVKEKVELKAQVDSLKKENAALRKEKAALRKEVASLREQLNQQGDVAHLKQQLAKLKAEMTAQASEKQALQQKKAALKDRGQAVASENPDGNPGSTSPKGAQNASSGLSTAEASKEQRPVHEKAKKKDDNKPGFFKRIYSSIPLIGGGGKQKSAAKTANPDTEPQSTSPKSAQNASSGPSTAEASKKQTADHEKPKKKDDNKPGFFKRIYSSIPLIGGGGKQKKTEGAEADEPSPDKKEHSEPVQLSKSDSKSDKASKEIASPSKPKSDKPKAAKQKKKKKGWFKKTISKIPFVGGSGSKKGEQERESAAKPSEEKDRMASTTQETDAPPSKQAKSKSTSTTQGKESMPDQATKESADNTDTNDSPNALAAADNSGSAEQGTLNSIPPGTGPLVAQAKRAFSSGNYQEAEKKYQQALQSDTDNVFILSNLAAIQIQRGKLESAKKHVKHALSEAPNDAFSLTLLGIVHFRQSRFDQALKVLRQAAERNPKDAKTQNYLGITLSQKGKRKAAEKALRKAVQLEPGYASAHYNLALVYATEEPSFPNLARYHYRKALNAGHKPNKELEKLLSNSSSGTTADSDKPTPRKASQDGSSSQSNEPAPKQSQTTSETK